jgi:hypothetical protein
MHVWIYFMIEHDAIMIEALNLHCVDDSFAHRMVLENVSLMKNGTVYFNEA